MLNRQEKKGKAEERYRKRNKKYRREVAVGHDTRVGGGGRALKTPW